MSTVIHQRHSLPGSVAASNTAFHHLSSNSAFSSSTTESNRIMIWRTGGVLSNLYILILTNDRGTSTLRTRKTTSNANVVVSITASTTGEFEDAVNTDAVTAGDNWHASLVTGSGGTTFTFGPTHILFAATTNTMQKLAGATADTFATASVTYKGAFFGDQNTSDVADSVVGMTVRTGATLTDLQVYASANARTTTTTYRSRVNSGFGNLTLDIAASATGTVEDTSNTDTLVSGDLINWSITSGTGTENLVVQVVSAELKTTDGTHQYVGGEGTSGRTITAGTTTFHPFSGRLTDSNTTESNFAVDTNLVMTTSLLQTNITANTIVLDSTLTLRKNSADGNQVVTITALTTGIFQDTTNSDSFVATDTLNHQIVTPSTITTLALNSISLLANSTTGVTVSVAALSMVAALTTGSKEIRKFPSPLTMAASIQTHSANISILPNALSATLSVQTGSKNITIIPSPLILSASLEAITLDGVSALVVLVQPLLMTLSLETGSKEIRKFPDAQDINLNLPEVSKAIRTVMSPLSIAAILGGVTPQAAIAANALSLSMTLEAPSIAISTDLTVLVSPLTMAIAVVQPIIATFFTYYKIHAKHNEVKSQAKANVVISTGMMAITPKISKHDQPKRNTRNQQVANTTKGGLQP